MDLKKHIIDTIKEWQLKIGYREGNMKLYYPGESLDVLLGNVRNTTVNEKLAEEELLSILNTFCEEAEPQLGRIKISGSYERYCLEIPAKGCAFVAGKVPEPEFLKRFLEVITHHGNSMEQIRECFAAYAEEHGTAYVEDILVENDEDVEVSRDCDMSPEHTHSHTGHAFYFTDATVEEYVYWVEENEFGLTYHRFTKADYKRLQ